MKYKASSRPALTDLTLEVDKGEFAFLIGPSGSGKSTFFRLLLKEDRPTSGDVYVGDFHVNTLKGRMVPKLRQSIGCVFQDFRLLQQKSVADNVAFALEVIGKSPSTIRRIVPEVLDYVGLSGKADRMPNELSGGEMQRVAIARAIVNRPLLLLADEPTGNLDSAARDSVLELFEELIDQENITLVMATHDDLIGELAERRIIVADGKILDDGLGGKA